MFVVPTSESLKRTSEGELLNEWRNPLKHVFLGDSRTAFEGSREENEVAFDEFLFQSQLGPTRIETAYLESGKRLLYVMFFNENTPGFAEYQKSTIQYMEEGELDSPPRHGAPGVPFSDARLLGLIARLRELFVGRETQYIQDGRLVSSKIEYSDGSPAWRCRHKEKPRVIVGSDEECADVTENKRTIPLDRIFDGFPPDE